MRIKKVEETPIPAGSAEIIDGYSESTTNGYSCNYINELNTYSTNERVIGTWIDGKPLYSRWTQKSVTGSATTTTLETITRSNYGVVWINKYFSQGNSGSIIGSYYTGSTDMQRVWIETGSQIMYQRGSTYPILPATVYYELRYTKTSD